MLQINAQIYSYFGLSVIQRTNLAMTPLQLIGWVGYQQQHFEFAREIGHQFTEDTCRLAENYFNNFN